MGILRSARKTLKQILFHLNCVYTGKNDGHSVFSCSLPITLAISAKFSPIFLGLSMRSLAKLSLTYFLVSALKAFSSAAASFSSGLQYLVTAFLKKSAAESRFSNGISEFDTYVKKRCAYDGSNVIVSSCSVAMEQILSMRNTTFYYDWILAVYDAVKQIMDCRHRITHS